MKILFFIFQRKNLSLTNSFGLVYDELKDNIKKVIKDIPKEYYKNIFKGSYDRKLKYIKKINSRKKRVKNYL